MAVVQISKIQVRRGQKNSGIGVPQLSSAEFAWAVDTQELFIGNGSIAEGAPEVGNTKVLTEHDNILSLANSYRFADSDVSISTSVFRGLQSKLDEIEVSVVDFGAVSDGSTDSREAFENALVDLFTNVDHKFRKILKVPNGVYIIGSDLNIPSGTIIRGENPIETVLDIGNNNLNFIDNGQKCRDVKFESITIKHDDGETVITNSENCSFENVIWQGNYTLGNTVFTPDTANCKYEIPTVSTSGYITISGSGVSSTVQVDFGIDALTFSGLLSVLSAQLNADATFNSTYVSSIVGNYLKINSLSNTVLASTIELDFTVDCLPSGSSVLVSNITPLKTEYTDGSGLVPSSVYWDNELFGTSADNITFKNCVFKETKLAIECHQTTVFDNHVKFIDCIFDTCDKAIYVGGVVGQGTHWQINDCKFIDIANEAFYSTAGRGTLIQRCEFKDCGNGTNDASNPISNIVYFGESYGNVIDQCASNRHQNACIVNDSSKQTKADFLNASRASLTNRNFSEIFLSDSARLLCVISTEVKYYRIEYTLRLSQHVRTGILTIVINTESTDIELSDDYHYSGGGILMTGFEFVVQLSDNDLDSGNDTITLSYYNPIISGATGYIEYNITSGV